MNGCSSPLCQLIVAGGIFALYRLNVDAFPDVTPVQVEIDTEAEGLAPQEVEQLITFPIENVMNGISGVTRVRVDLEIRPVGGNGLFPRRRRYLFRARAGLSTTVDSKGRHAVGVRAEHGPDHDRHGPDLSLSNRRSRARAIRNCAPSRTGSSNYNCALCPASPTC